MTNDEETKKGTSPWVWILGCGCLFVIAIVGGCGAMFYYGFSKMSGNVDNAHVTFPAMITDTQKQAELTAKIEELQGLSQDKANKFALGTMLFALEETFKQDGTMDDNEYKQMMEFIDDVIAAGGKMEGIQPDFGPQSSESTTEGASESGDASGSGK